MPAHDRLPSPRKSLMQRFWQIFRLLVLLSIVIAGLAVALVARGDPEPFAHVHMLVATALGIGFMVLVGTSLMSLLFISNSSGHDDAAANFHEESDPNDRS